MELPSIKDLLIKHTSQQWVDSLSYTTFSSIIDAVAEYRDKIEEYKEHRINNLLNK